MVHRSAPNALSYWIGGGRLTTAHGANDVRRTVSGPPTAARRITRITAPHTAIYGRCGHHRGAAGWDHWIAHKNGVNTTNLAVTRRV